MGPALACEGEEPVRRKPFPAWPVFDHGEEDALLRVLHSGKWWQFAYGYGVELEENEALPRAEVTHLQAEFAALHGCSQSV